MASFLLSLLLVISGCAPVQLVPDEALFKTWQGKLKDELIAAFGPPASERSADKGMTILTWKKAQRHPSGISYQLRTTHSSHVMLISSRGSPLWLVLGPPYS